MPNMKTIMPNMKPITNAHNKRVTSENIQSATTRTCNCARNTTCPMDGNCLSENSLYAGTVTSNLPHYGEQRYAVVSAPPWKKRFANHKTSFIKRNYEKNSALAKEVWRIKDNGGEYNIDWRVIGHAGAYNPVSKRCNLSSTLLKTLVKV